MQVSGGGDDYGHFVSLQSGSTFGEDILLNEPDIIWCSYPDLRCSFPERHFVAIPYHGLQCSFLERHYVAFPYLPYLVSLGSCSDVCQETHVQCSFLERHYVAR